jgi:hypothetical protein
MAVQRPIWFAFLVVAMIPGAVHANCKDQQTGWLWNYDGTIGERYRVRVSLTATQDEVTGVYFYVTQLKDIQLKGRIVNGKQLMLDELGADGKVSARFEGEFAERDPRGKLKGALNCEMIVGSWHGMDGKEKLPFVLYLENRTYGTLEHRYSVAGARDDDLIHRKAYRFWNAVIKGDKRTVASLIRYPIKAQVAGRPKTLRSPSDLLSEYNVIFSHKFQKAIASAVPRNMFVRDLGIMLGGGEVWLGPDGDVIALNNQ